MKEGDIKTEDLTNFKIATTDLSNQTCFIIDDICDGGGTFVGIAKMLEKREQNIRMKKVIMFSGSMKELFPKVYGMKHKTYWR